MNKIQSLYFAIGFCPISALCLSLIGVVPLPITTSLLVVPAYLLAIVLGLRFPKEGKLALAGLLCGISATLVYDLTRWPLIFGGVWPDFIPKIGDLLTQHQGTHWAIGYAWRYLGNGGGMGVSFVMAAGLLDKRMGMVEASILYGTVIWLCLLATLCVCPVPEKLMFALTPMTFISSLIGHLVYGGVLGLQLNRLQPAYRRVLSS